MASLSLCLPPPQRAFPCFLFDLLQHSYRAKYVFLRHLVLVKVAALCSCQDRSLVLAGIRFLRATLGESLQAIARCMRAEVVSVAGVQPHSPASPLPACRRAGRLLQPPVWQARSARSSGGRPAAIATPR